MPNVHAPRRDPGEGRPDRARAPWALAAVVGLFVVTVVVLASGTAPARDGGSASADVLIVGLAVVVSAAAVALGVAAWLRRSPSGLGKPVDDTDSVLHILRRQRLAAAVVTLVLLGLMVGFVASYLERDAPPISERLPRASTTIPEEPTRSVDSGGTTSGTWRLLLAGALGVAAVGTAILATRSGVAGRSAGSATTQVTDALTTSIADLDDLGDEADNRQVVIRCYARMARAAALGGVATAPSDTPSDLVSRITAGTDADPAACQRLRDLFEHARFSPHPVDDAMRAEAAAALRAIRAALLAPARAEARPETVR